MPAHPTHAHTPKAWLSLSYSRLALLSRVAQLGGFDPVLLRLDDDSRRDFAKAYFSMVTHCAKFKPGFNSNDNEPNAAMKLFDAYGVPHHARPPQWFISLARELADAAEDLVYHPRHRAITHELRVHHPDKAGNVSSELHYVLCPYEYEFLDACLEYGASIGLQIGDDCLDGALWFAGSFPANVSISTVFDNMTVYARNATGMQLMTIREKKMKLPSAMPLATRKVEINGWVNPGEAGLDGVFEYCDRHWTSIQGRTKSVVIDRWFFQGTDRVDEVIERTIDEHKRMYQSCKVTVAGPDGKPRLEPIGVLWLERNDRPVKEHLDFLPSQAERDRHPEILSASTGLRLDASEPIDRVTAADHPGVQAINAHVHEILANGNLELSTYLTNFHAWAVQKRIKSGIMVVFVGESGVGKSTLYFKSTHNHPIFPQMFEKTYMSCNGIRQLTARFNVNSANKLWCSIEEVPENAGKASMAELKYLADSSRIDIEAKHTDTCSVRDNRNFIACTNYKNAFGLDGSTNEISRKFLFVEVSDKYSHANCRDNPALKAEADAWFTALNDHMADPETVRHFFWYLMTTDLSGWKPMRDMPETDLMRSYRADADAIPAWFEAWSSGGWTFRPDLPQFSPPAPEDDATAFAETKFFSSKLLFELFQKWADDTSCVHSAICLRTFYLSLTRFATSHSLGKRWLTPASSTGHMKGYKTKRQPQAPQPDATAS